MKCYCNNSRLCWKSFSFVIFLVAHLLLSQIYYVMSTWHRGRMRKRKLFLQQSQTELGFVVAPSIWSKVWIVSLTTKHRRNFFEIQFRKPFVFYKGAEVGWCSDISVSETSWMIYLSIFNFGNLSKKQTKINRNPFFTHIYINSYICVNFFVGIVVP